MSLFIGSKSFHKFVVMNVLVGLTVSCGAFETKSKGRKASENDRGLTGEWHDQCTSADWLGVTHQRSTLKFSILGDFERSTTLYSDGECKTSASTLFEAGTYQALGRSSVAPDSDDINFTMMAAKITPLTDEIANSLNQSKYCGISDWARGRERDVMQLDCFLRKHTKGEVIFDVYRLTGKEYLTLGKSSIWFDKTEAAARPEKIDEGHVFAKQ